MHYNIMHISQLSLKRLLHRAGIKRISNNTYEHVYNYMNSYLNDISDKVHNLTKNRSNQTITTNDINNGYVLTNIIGLIQTQNGGNFGYCHDEVSQCSDPTNQLLPGATSTSRCGPQNGGNQPTYCDNQPSQCGEVCTKPLVGGNQALYCDNQPSQCGTVCNIPLIGGSDKNNNEYYFTIPQTQFYRFIQGGSSELKSKKITKSGFQQLQFLVENNTINYLMNKNMDLKNMNVNEFSLNQ